MSEQWPYPVPGNLPYPDAAAAAISHDSIPPIAADNNPDKWTPPSGSPPGVQWSPDYIAAGGPSAISTLEPGQAALPPPMMLGLPPTLDMLWSSVYDVVPDLNQQQGSGQSPAYDEITMSFPACLAAERTVLDQLKTLVPQYTALADAYQQDARAPGFYGQQATATILVAYFNQTGWSNDLGADPSPQQFYGNTQYGVRTVDDAQLQYLAQSYAPSLDLAMTNALDSLANTIEALGRFIALVRIAADSYCSADVTSALQSYDSLVAQWGLQPPPVTGS
jgi:hypothetical protein